MALLAGRLAHRLCGGGGEIIAPLERFSEGVGDADLPQTVLTVWVCVLLGTTGITDETVWSNADLPASAATDICPLHAIG